MSNSLSSSTAEPRWVLHHGVLCDVSDFAHLSPKERPQTFCPFCERAVLLKLGKVRAHHYAHACDCDCAFNHPETALHANVKFHFYKQLLEASGTPAAKLSMKQRCSQAGCDARRVWEWVQDWDEARVEYRINPIRPDIALLREGRVLAALEIFVTHAVDEQKAAHLQHFSIPWAEIAAKESIYEGEATWKISDPLPSIRHHPPVPDWTCPECQQKLIERRHQQEAEAERREYARLNHTKTYAERMIDFFFPTGDKHREIFEVRKVVLDGQQVMSLLRSKRRGVLHSVEGALTQETFDHFMEIVETETEKLVSKGTIVDNVVPWRKVTKENRRIPRDEANFPPRYYWKIGENAWKSVEGPTSLQMPPRYSSHPTSYKFGSYPCIWCGQVTDDWYWRDAQGNCRCNACARKRNPEQSSAR